MKKLLSISEVVRDYGISRATVYRQAKKGEFPIKKIGRMSRVDRDDLTRWMERLPELK